MAEHTDRDPIVLQLRGRADFLAKYGNVKSVDLMERAACRIDALVKALDAAKDQLIATGGDPRSHIGECGSYDNDMMQAAILDQIEEALEFSSQDREVQS